jgi:hypothetical protein
MTTRAAVMMVMAVAGLAGCARGVPQPLAFNHRLHADNSVSCPVCHASATTGQGATLPAVAVCRRCHEDVLYESPEEVKIRLAVESGRGLDWVPVFALRPYVYFSHRRHVTLGKVACASCHGDVERRTMPFQLAASPFAGLGGMKACVRCHDESHSPYAGVDCVDCHR